MRCFVDAIFGQGVVIEEAEEEDDDAPVPVTVDDADEEAEVDDLA